ncbi:MULTISPECIES: HypC/HybG/HupF family hydrogenase formation chaperone [Marichromatium]|uniref:Hydrogenase expression/formation protein HypC n=1 Tax=Marichromatium gracile TaxID=1048 RepID=A0A4R4A9U7_MARGR|nr:MULTISPECIES: HypC/HybG/HupF family hydrogenase formation chaperone [Marichromatium]MBO8086391.1 HypC/HybG/HupF family hydrogenase formation chaperone [Marichromatium sp.]MBK1710287.1 RNA methyltransferase [Marichromatium gracile]RNE88605.1 HypC/HybG/HupF family hydrogenase formation chaperone [Marichromatium sp. AB31]RNE92469.1 HypC/HybG/HupF family hydrogenase formation chaperone [Marichromatium sp. AB32]TCW35514.1 hydrogenase expression/formation protein HypC [Marichromatium gracile]
MCIGVPMEVIESGPCWAWCVDGERRLRVDMRLVGEQPPGTWVLVFLESAREVMDAGEAQRVRDALLAMRLALDGESVDHLFADLIEREPQLPEHLRAKD